MDIDLSERERVPFRILVVCTGNTCRSPMAEVIARRRVGELGWADVEVRSAGVGAFEGSPASGGALRAARAHGLDLSMHSSTRLTREGVESADVILTMSASHLHRVIELGGGGRADVITSFASEGDDLPTSPGVPDPIGGPDEEYAETFRVLDDLIVKVLTRLEPAVMP